MQTEPKYTAGPWKQTPHAPGLIYGADGLIVCDCDIEKDPMDPRAISRTAEIVSANSALIAAAPELLDALKEAEQIILCATGLITPTVECDAAASRIRAAIAKAEGGA